MVKKLPLVSVICTITLSLLILFQLPESYEFDQVDLKVGIDMPKAGFLTVGDDVPITITVTNNSNETRYFQITEVFRPDQIPDSYHVDPYMHEATINAKSTTVFHHTFVARSSDLWWLIVSANGFEKSTYIGYLISNQSFTSYYVHPSFDLGITALAESTKEGGVLSFVGTIIGGAVSGSVGFFIAWYTNKLQDKERLKDNVYRKLYGYVFRLNEQNAPFDAISTEEWTRIEPYELIKMDPKIRQKFDTLTSEIEIWNRFCNTVSNNYNQNQQSINKILRDALSKHDVLNENGNITINDSNYSVDGFTQMFLLEILNPNIKDFEMLYKIMLEYSQKNFPYRMKEIIYLKEHKPRFFEVLFNQLPALRQMCLLDFNYEDVIMLRDGIKKRISGLKEELTKLVK